MTIRAAESMVAPRCPLCQRPAVLVDSAEIYGTSYGRVWRCPSVCNTYVGAHPDGRPKGTLAWPSLRKARIRAHAAFDGWWRRQGLTRRAAYRVLAAQMQVAEAHIGAMTEAECARVERLFREPTAELDAVARGVA